jgi:hypothetical protein
MRAFLGEEKNAQRYRRTDVAEIEEVEDVVLGEPQRDGNGFEYQECHNWKPAASKAVHVLQTPANYLRKTPIARQSDWQEFNYQALFATIVPRFAHDQIGFD